MRHVVARAGKFGQQNIARHHHVFRSGRDPAQAQPGGVRAFVHVAAGREMQILAMIDDGQVERPGKLHGAPHHARVHHRAPVVGNRDNARFLHRADGGKLDAFAALGDRTDGPYVHGGMIARAAPRCNW